jgi:hypothetical protein
MSNDLRNIKPELRDILLNNEIIAVNQDKLGKQGTRVSSNQGLEVWKRELSDGLAVVLFNHKNPATATIRVSMKDLGFGDKAYARDLFAKKDLGLYSAFTSSVPIHGVVMIKLTHA